MPPCVARVFDFSDNRRLFFFFKVYGVPFFSHFSSSILQMHAKARAVEVWMYNIRSNERQVPFFSSHVQHWRSRVCMK